MSAPLHRRPAPQTPRPSPGPALERPERVRFPDLAPSGCRWAVGADERYRHLFCNTETVEGSSYCLAHTRLSLKRATEQ
jgi:hypothetical protein